MSCCVVEPKRTEVEMRCVVPRAAPGRILSTIVHTSVSSVLGALLSYAFVAFSEKDAASMTESVPVSVPATLPSTPAVSPVDRLLPMAERDEETNSRPSVPLGSETENVTLDVASGRTALMSSVISSSTTRSVSAPEPSAEPVDASEVETMASEADEVKSSAMSTSSVVAMREPSPKSNSSEATTVSAESDSRTSLDTRASNVSVSVSVAASVVRRTSTSSPSAVPDSVVTVILDESVELSRIHSPTSSMPSVVSAMPAAFADSWSATTVKETSEPASVTAVGDAEMATRGSAVAKSTSTLAVWPLSDAKENVPELPDTSAGVSRTKATSVTRTSSSPSRAWSASLTTAVKVKTAWSLNAFVSALSVKDCASSLTFTPVVICAPRVVTRNWVISIVSGISTVSVKDDVPSCKRTSISMSIDSPRDRSVTPALKAAVPVVANDVSDTVAVRPMTPESIVVARSIESVMARPRPTGVTLDVAAKLPVAVKLDAAVPTESARTAEKSIVAVDVRPSSGMVRSTSSPAAEPVAITVVPSSDVSDAATISKPGSRSTVTKTSSAGAVDDASCATTT